MTQIESLENLAETLENEEIIAVEPVENEAEVEVANDDEEAAEVSEPEEEEEEAQ